MKPRSLQPPGNRPDAWGARRARTGGSALLGLLVAAAGGQAAQAAVCKVPDMAHPTIQKAVDDAACTDIVLGAQVYTEQVSIGRSLTLRGAGPGRTILRSPMRRVRSTVTASYLSGFTYVVEVKPGGDVALNDLSVDGNGDASCSERYFGVRVHNAALSMDRVVIEKVRGTAMNLGCNPNVIALAATADTGKNATLTVEQGTVRAFQATGILVYGTGTSATIKNSVVHGIGAQDRVFQNGVFFRNGATGAVDRVTVTELRFTGDPCKGVGTALQSFRAGQIYFTANVLRGVDRGIWLHENQANQVATENRIVGVQAGILSNNNGAGKVRLTRNGVSDVSRSTAATVDMCFAESGDGLAVRAEKSTSVISNSIAGSARAAIELGTGSDSTDVQQNQATRSTRYDLEDRGTTNRLALNLCNTSSPAGLCTGKP